MNIDGSNIGQAIDLLVEGFPGRDIVFWEQGIERIQAMESHASGGVPIGQFLMSKDKPVGVGLTIVDDRPNISGEIKRHINLSSMYVADEHRWRTPLLLRKLINDPEAVYLDVTPTVSVQKMLRTFDFYPLNNGVALVMTPVASMIGGNKSRLVAFSELPGGVLTDCEQDLFERHIQRGCRFYAFETEEGWHPLLFKKRHMLGIPVADLLYCRDNAAFHKNIGPVARSILKQGIPLIVMDNPVFGRAPGIKFTSRWRRMGTAELSPNTTDYTSTEVVLFDF